MQIAAPQSPVLGLGLERRQEQLSRHSLQYDLQLTDRTGRSVQLSISAEQLHHQGSYDRLGLIAGPGRGLDPATDLRGFVAGQLAQQQHGDMAATTEHRSLSLSASRVSIAVSGDADLLAEHLAADSTAQRIMDMALGLGRDIPRDSTAFGDFVEEISRGIAEGFEAAETLLGELPTVSRSTRELLDEMLAALRRDPTQPPPRAADLLAGRPAVEDAISR